METFSVLLALSAGNSPVIGEFSSQSPVRQSFNVFFGLRLNKRFRKQPIRWLFGTPSRSLWSHYIVKLIQLAIINETVQDLYCWPFLWCKSINNGNAKRIQQSMHSKIAPKIIFKSHRVNILWFSVTIWRHRPGSTLVQVMVCCLTATSQYVSQLWLLISVWFSSIHLRAISPRVPTVYPKKYAHGFLVLCFAVVMQSVIMNSYEVFIHINQGCFAGTGAIVRLPQCQWSKPDGYGKISQCITTTKHSKAKTVCIFLGIYCTYLFLLFENYYLKLLPHSHNGLAQLHVSNFLEWRSSMSFKEWNYYMRCIPWYHIHHTLVRDIRYDTEICF